MTARADCVWETSVTTGTGNLTLVNKVRSFNDAFGTGGSDLFYYFIYNIDVPGEWEVGTGHLSDATTLVRDTVIRSSNTGAKVNFSAGSKFVVNDIPSDIQVSTNLAQTLASKTLSAPTINSPVINGNISGNAFLDEDNMSSNSATKVASQQSIKAYVDSFAEVRAAAWVCFRGNSTVFVRDSFNVSSVTDNGTGVYTVNFTNNMANTNYAAVATHSTNSGQGSAFAKNEVSVSDYRINCTAAGGAFDPDHVSSVVFGG